MNGVLKRYDPPGRVAPQRDASLRRALMRIALALVVGFDWQVFEAGAQERHSRDDGHRPLSPDEMMMLHLIPRA